MSEAPQTVSAPAVKLALDLGAARPLLSGFEICAGYDDQKIYAATGTLMVAAVLALGIEYVRLRKISPVPLVTALMVLVFGGLTLYLKDARFIKMKPTALYSVLRVVLLGGLLFDSSLVKHALSQAFELSEEAWRKLTLR